LNRLATEGVTDFAALERDLLAALKQDGGRWLEQLLNDPALPYKNNQPQADEQDYGQRPKAVLLTLGWIELRRTRCCANCSRGWSWITSARHAP